MSEGLALVNSSAYITLITLGSFKCSVITIAVLEDPSLDLFLLHVRLHVLWVYHQVLTLDIFLLYYLLR